MNIRQRLDALENRKTAWTLVDTCPECRAEVVGRWQPGEPCDRHQLAPPPAPGERRIIIEHVREGLT